MSVHLAVRSGNNNSNVSNKQNYKDELRKLLEREHNLPDVEKEENDTPAQLKGKVKSRRKTIRFNIGGVIFETYWSTILRHSELKVSDKTLLFKHYKPEENEYFFDRNPEVFSAILNYLRTGELHIPSYVCGPAAKAELEFWGISDDVIERCCWTNYNSWNSTQQALTQLEKDRKVSFYQPDTKNLKGWRKWQAQAWEILNRPNASRVAKVYGYISLFFVTLSIFVFIAETHPTFAYFIDVQESANASSDNQSAINTTQAPTFRQVAVEHPVLNIINICCVCFFAVEYAARVVFAQQKIKYIRSLMGVIDFLALAPDGVQLIAYAIKPELQYEGTVSAIAILRIARVLRVFRLIRHVPGLWILIYTLKASLKELLLMTVFLLVGMLVFSSLMYYVEDRADFQSIPHGFWWALITMTTVGYGDMYPKTAWGYLIGSFTALMGLLMIGFSVPVLVSNFIMYYKHVEFAVSQENHKKEKENLQNKLEERSEQEISLLDKKGNNLFVNNNSTPKRVLLTDVEKQSVDEDA